MYTMQETNKLTRDPVPSRKKCHGDADVTHQLRTNFSQLLQRSLGNNYLQAMARGSQTFGQASRQGGVPIIRRKCACGDTCANCAGKEEELRKIQPKLTIGPVNDAYEQEADRVAEQVMRMPDSSPSKGMAMMRQAPNISRYIGQGAAKYISRQPAEQEVPALAEEEADESDLLSLKEVPGTSHEMSAGLATQIQALRGGGQPLAPDVRAFFEPRFDYDFSRVRIHTGAQAAETTQHLRARAYTIGGDIAFATGEYQPETLEGRMLLAHELTHVVQQGDQVRTVMRACACSSFGASNPTADQEASLSGKLFPRLKKGDWCVTAPATATYNCFAWSIGNTSKRIDKEVDSVYGNNNGALELSDFDKFYAANGGLKPVIGRISPDPKVALFAKGGVPTHAARISAAPCGGFESKLGKYIRIVHDVTQLEGGPTYGDVVRFYD